MGQHHIVLLLLILLWAAAAVESAQDAVAPSRNTTAPTAAVAVAAGPLTSRSPDVLYQEEVLQRCQGVLPERFKHGYAHYSGPMMEEYFYSWWLKRQPALPQTYLPIGWSTYFFSAARVTFNATEVTRAKRQVEELLAGLDKRRSYFSVVQFAGLIRVEQLAIPCDLKLTLFVGGGPEDQQQAQHLKFIPIPLLSKVLKPARRHRPKLVSFAGGFLFWQDPGGLRSQMRDLLQNKTGFSITDRVPDWEEVIHRSVFHLCPRGNGPTSYRLYEALQADTIPIYIWEDIKWLAFEDIVDWETIALVVHRRDMAAIPERVAAADAAAMRANIGKLRGLWQYNHTAQYIAQRVQATSKDPDLLEYHPNSTECTAAASVANDGAAVRGEQSADLAQRVMEVDGVHGDTSANAAAHLHGELPDLTGSLDSHSQHSANRSQQPIDAEEAALVQGALVQGTIPRTVGAGSRASEMIAGENSTAELVVGVGMVLFVAWVCRRAVRRRSRRLAAGRRT